MTAQDDAAAHAARDDQSFQIDVERDNLERAVEHMSQFLNLARGATTRLMSEQVYDVEMVEGAAARVVPAALAQIEVALTAIKASIPDGSA